MSESLINIYRVWRRYFLLFKKDLLYSLTTTIIEPLLFLLSLGFGLGAIIGTIQANGQEVSYRSFILTGLIGQVVLFQGFFQSAYGSYFRIYYQKVFHNIVTTPITLSEIIWGELIWDATRGAFPVSIILIIGNFTHDFGFFNSLITLFFSFFSSLIFSAAGLFITAISKSVNQIAYPVSLFVMPMFLFCGVFFPIDQMPPFLQICAWLLPLTSTLSLTRWLLLDFPLEIQAIPIFILWLIILVYISKRSVTKLIVGKH